MATSADVASSDHPVNERVIRPSGGGIALRTHAGQTVWMELPENPTTGYAWVVREPSPQVRLSSEFIHSITEDEEGAPGTRRFGLVAVTAGTYSLLFEFVRPWGEATPIRRLRVDLFVEGTE